MIAESENVAHHEQLPLCTTRLPYRQGRKLTAVKVYTINNESNHLLVFGVPSLSLRQETKALFAKFGTLLHFVLSKNHSGEDFTETYHARYKRIQSARIAKRMLDTKNFYGGSLHVCYAPEFETLDETRNKLMLRQKDVIFRLRNLQKEPDEVRLDNQANVDIAKNGSSFNDNCDIPIINEVNLNSYEDDSIRESEKLNMGNENLILLNKNKRKKDNKAVIEKRFKACFEDNHKSIPKAKKSNVQDNIEAVDCTSVEKDVVSNIDEALNYNTFGNEIIRKVAEKPVNRIIFKCNKKSFAFN